LSYVFGSSVGGSISSSLSEFSVKHSYKP